MSLKGQTHYLYKSARKSSFILHVKTVQRQEACVTGLYQKMFKMLDIVACFYILILFHPPSISALFIEEEQHICFIRYSFRNHLLTLDHVVANLCDWYSNLWNSKCVFFKEISCLLFTMKVNEDWGCLICEQIVLLCTELNDPVHKKNKKKTQMIHSLDWICFQVTQWIWNDMKVNK